VGLSKGQALHRKGMVDIDCFSQGAVKSRPLHPRPGPLVDIPVFIDYDRNLSFIDGHLEGRRLKSIFRHAGYLLREHTDRMLGSPVRAFAAFSHLLDGERHELFFRVTVCDLLRAMEQHLVCDSVMRLPCSLSRVALEVKQRPNNALPSRFRHVWHAHVACEELAHRALVVDYYTEQAAVRASQGSIVSLAEKWKLTVARRHQDVAR
jgi:hypothetical protein